MDPLLEAFETALGYGLSLAGTVIGLAFAAVISPFSAWLLVRVTMAMANIKAPAIMVRAEKFLLKWWLIAVLALVTLPISLPVLLVWGCAKAGQAIGREFDEASGRRRPERRRR